MMKPSDKDVRATDNMSMSGGRNGEFLHGYVGEGEATSAWSLSFSNRTHVMWVPLVAVLIMMHGTNNIFMYIIETKKMHAEKKLEKENKIG